MFELEFTPDDYLPDGTLNNKGLLKVSGKKPKENIVYVKIDNQEIIIKTQTEILLEKILMELQDIREQMNQRG
jgi:hypothetical protein